MKIVQIHVYFLLLGQGCSLIINTYNIWNTMFSWPIRKLRINEMIRLTDSDVIAFQEVRSNSRRNSTNQIAEIQALLPSYYRWHIFKVANNVSFVDGTIDTSYSEEGIGIISRLPIVDSSTQYLVPHPRDPDKNKRAVVHARVRDSAGTLYDIVVVHLSYYRQQQCRNIADITEFIRKRKLQNVIILGDFNTYNDYNWPVEIFLQGKVTRANPCWRIKQDADLSGMSFQDSWLVTHTEEGGLTFSNMPSPGMESRPDRVLVESKLKVKSVQLVGDGRRYKQRYKAALHWSRFTTIIQSAYFSYKDVKGYACTHDCGPHGSCQCGVCVAIGNKHDCLLPDCDICNADIFKTLVIHCVLYIILFIHLFYSIVSILTIGAHNYSDTLHSILGFKCCLFNPKLYKFNVRSFRSFRRKRTFLKLFQIWPVFWLPPYMQFFMSLILLIALWFYSRHIFQPVIDLTYNTLNEELFPSDHLMVVAEIT